MIMKKMKVKKLSLDKLKIAKLENVSYIRGGHGGGKSNGPRCPFLYVIIDTSRDPNCTVHTIDDIVWG